MVETRDGSRSLAVAALGSLALWMAACLAFMGLLSWWYARFLDDLRQTSAWRLVLLQEFWLRLAWLIAPLCLWWLANFLAEARRRPRKHRRFARADLLLAPTVILSGLLVYEQATLRVLPTELYDCFEGRMGNGLTGTCIRTEAGISFLVTIVAAGCFLFGLVWRVRRTPEQAAG